MKLSFYIFVVGAFFERASCDRECIWQKISNISMIDYNVNPVSYCNNIEQKFDRAREDLKTCTRHEIDIDEFESVQKELCTNGSDFKRDLEEHSPCVHEQYGIFQLKCKSEVINKYRDIVQKGLRDYERVMELCNEVVELFANCLGESIAKPCGEGAMTVYKRLVDSRKPLHKTICLEVVQARILSDDDDDIGVPASATSSWATRRIIQLGVSFAVLGAVCLTFAICKLFGQISIRTPVKHGPEPATSPS